MMETLSTNINAKSLDPEKIQDPAGIRTQLDTQRNVGWRMDVNILRIEFKPQTMTWLHRQGIHNMQSMLDSNSALISPPGQLSHQDMKLKARVHVCVQFYEFAVSISDDLDFEPLEMNITFDTSVTEKVVQILISNDDMVETTEMFTVNITAVDGLYPLKVLDSELRLDIIDNDRELWEAVLGSCMCRGYPWDGRCPDC